MEKELYHCTARENLRSILEHGLVPKKPIQVENWKSRETGVYLSKAPFEWMHWATNESKVAGVIILIDVTGLNVVESIGITHDDKEIPEYICLEQIPVERFIRVSISTDKNPCSFEELKKENKE